MSQYGATKGAAESQIAQINSQCKLASLRLENRKIRYEITKQANILPKGSNLKG
jgi:hypothetical protein